MSRMAAGITMPFGTKVAWKSSELFERQKHVDTFDIALHVLLLKIRDACAAVWDRPIPRYDALTYVVNFGNYFTSHNDRSFSVIVKEPSIDEFNVRLVIDTETGAVTWRFHSRVRDVVMDFGFSPSGDTTTVRPSLPHVPRARNLDL